MGIGSFKRTLSLRTPQGSARNMSYNFIANPQAQVKKNTNKFERAVKIPNFIYLFLVFQQPLFLKEPLLKTPASTTVKALCVRLSCL